MKSARPDASVVTGATEVVSVNEGSVTPVGTPVPTYFVAEKVTFAIVLGVEPSRVVCWLPSFLVLPVFPACPPV